MELAMGCERSSITKGISLGMVGLGLIGLPLAYFGLKQRAQLAGLTASVASIGIGTTAAFFRKEKEQGAPLSGRGNEIKLPGAAGDKGDGPQPGGKRVPAAAKPAALAEAEEEEHEIEPTLVRVTSYWDDEQQEVRSYDGSLMLSSLYPEGKPYKNEFDGERRLNEVYLYPDGSLRAEQERGASPQGKISFSPDAKGGLVYRQFYKRAFKGGAEEVTRPLHTIKLKCDGETHEIARDNRDEYDLGQMATLEFGQVRITLQLPAREPDVAEVQTIGAEKKNEEAPIVEVTSFWEGEPHVERSRIASQLLSALCPGGKPVEGLACYAYGKKLEEVYVYSDGTLSGKLEARENPQGIIHYSADESGLVYHQYTPRIVKATRRGEPAPPKEYPLHEVSLKCDDGRFLIACDNTNAHPLGAQARIKFDKVKLVIHDTEIEDDLP